MKPTNKFLVYVAACISAATAAVGADSGLSESRMLRNQRDIQPSVTLPALRVWAANADTEAPKWAFAFSAGGAYTDFDAGGDAWNTPLLFSASREAYTLTLETDGYSDSGDISGVNDVLVTVRKRLWMSDDKKHTWLFGGGATIPVGGDAGSDRTKERVTLTYKHALSENSGFSLTGSLRRSEQAAKDDLNPYTQVLAAQVYGPLSEKIGGFLQFVAAHPNGGDWSTTAIGGVEFPLTETLGGTFSLAQGLKSGEKDTAISFEVSMSW
mgnify:CR=1 FL=1